jgi:signal transduction histidine kinase
MKHHILIVEDSPTQAEQLRHLLEEHGYKVTVATNGKEGLAAARTHKPALIITDIVMPVMNGHELCHALKEDEALMGIPIILLTSLSSLEDVIRGLNSGADFYLTKPCDGDFLLRRVKVALAAPPVQQKRTEAKELEIAYLGKRYVITSDRQQILKLLFSTYEGAVRQNQELSQAQLELQRLNEQLETRVRERTAALRDAQEELIRQEKLAVLGQLAGGVGHELRNPLGAISNAAYFLNMVIEEPDPEIQETLEILDKEVRTSERIISSLLDFARTKPPTWRKVDINEVVQEALSRAAVPENVEVVSQLNGTLPATLADPDQLVQVFGNIILNAVQAMPEGGQLVVEASRDSDFGEPPEVSSPEWVAVSFTDTGVGISEENLGKLFEPLFTTKAKGIGLGLAITRTLVEGHGGSIEVRSEVGEGSTFTVKLPTNGRQEKT